MESSVTPPAPAPHVVTRHRGLVARTVLVSLLTLVSRLLGFVREALMAFVFGDRSPISDAFYTAWRVPNLFRRLLGEGALSTSLQAAMTQADAERGDEAGRALFLRTARVLAVILLAITVVGSVVIWLLPDQAPFHGGDWLGPYPAPVRDLTARLLPYVFLVCLAAICGGALAVRGHFTIPNVAPTLMNLVWIGTLVLIGITWNWGRESAGDPAQALDEQWHMARWLAWGLLLGGLVQLLVHVPPLARYRLLGGEALTDDSRVRAWKVLRDTAPLAFGAAIYQFNVWIDGMMAQGLLATGGSTALYYANRVQQFPLALISTAAVSAVFPSLAAYAHVGSRAQVRNLHDRTQLGILFLALPAAAGLFALALPIASACYEHGNYGFEGTRRIAEGLRCLAFALVPAGAVALVSRVYIAMGDMKTPVRIAGLMLVLNVGLNVVAVVGFGLDVAGLTLATTLTAWINLVWLVRGLRTKLGLPTSAPVLRGRVGRIALASLLAALVAWAVHAAAAAALGAAEPRRSIPALFAGIAAACVTYSVAARVLAIPEWGEIVRRLRARLVGRS